MKRKDFLKTCALGACGCGVMGLLAQAEARTERSAGQTPAGADDAALLKVQLDGGRERFALLLGIMRGARRSRPRPNPAEAGPGLFPKACPAPEQIQRRPQGVPCRHPDRLAGEGRARRDGRDPARHRQARPLRLPDGEAGPDPGLVLPLRARLAGGRLFLSHRKARHRGDRGDGPGRRIPLQLPPPVLMDPAR
jgi:hypothetical protein